MKSWGYAIIAVLVVLAVIAGVGGYVLGVAAGQRRANNLRSEFIAQRFGNVGAQGQAGANGARGQGQFGRPAASGTVKSVEGNTLVVTTANGEVKVQVGDKAIVTKMDPGTVKDIQPGMRVSVAGETAPSGVVNATAVQLLH